MDYYLIFSRLFAIIISMKKNLLSDYSLQLATEIETLCKSLKDDDCSNIIFQIKKSSSSIAANIAEAQYPQSLPDMLSKLKIARKECVETEYWLKHLSSSGYISNDSFSQLRNLCGRIKEEVDAFYEGNEQFDDITELSMQFKKLHVGKSRKQ